MLLTSTILITSTAWSFGAGHGRGMDRNRDTLNQFPVYNLSVEQRNDLKFMWEEEKLARDVYITLGQQYSELRIFKNISKAEQRHMDAIKVLTDKYNITIPSDYSIGKFKTPAFQDLYKKLITQGSSSIEDAIDVGYSIEVLDIKDLKERLNESSPKDMEFVFTRLIKASYKHKRAFERFTN